MIEASSPRLRFARFSAAVQEAVRIVLAGDRFILGREVDRFEAAFAAYLGVDHCVGVNSGTDALVLALKALGIGAGDEVVTASMTASATGVAILLTGARPRFVDVDVETRCLDLDLIEAALTPHTVAVLPVHLHGYPVPMPRLMEIARRHRLAVIEDCAQAHGARIDGRPVGSFGDIAAFSFYPTKNLGCPGDGGVVATNDPALARRTRGLRSYGWFDERRISTEVGHNSRLDEIQAAVLNVLLPHLDEGNQERTALAGRYRVLLHGADIGLPAANGGAVHHQFAISVPRRDAVRAALRERAGIETGIHYPVPLHLQPLFADCAATSLPVTEHLAQSMMSLPIQPEVVGDNLEYIARSVRKGVAEWTAS